jgi:hypothetical protein
MMPRRWGAGDIPGTGRNSISDGKCKYAVIADNTPSPVQECNHLKARQDPAQTVVFPRRASAHRTRVGLVHTLPVPLGMPFDYSNAGWSVRDPFVAWSLAK